MASIATLGSAAWFVKCFFVLFCIAVMGVPGFLKRPLSACRTEDLVSKICLKDVPEFMKLQDSSSLKADRSDSLVTLVVSC